LEGRSALSYNGHFIFTTDRGVQRHPGEAKYVMEIFGVGAKIRRLKEANFTFLFQGMFMSTTTLQN